MGEAGTGWAGSYREQENSHPEWYDYTAGIGNLGGTNHITLHLRQCKLIHCTKTSLYQNT